MGNVDGLFGMWKTRPKLRKITWTRAIEPVYTAVIIILKGMFSGTCGAVTTATQLHLS